jgi:hypothetical protein
VDGDILQLERGTYAGDMDFGGKAVQVVGTRRLTARSLPAAV